MRFLQPAGNVGIEMIPGDRFVDSFADQHDSSNVDQSFFGEFKQTGKHRDADRTEADDADGTDFSGLGLGGSGWSRNRVEIKMKLDKKKNWFQVLNFGVKNKRHNHQQG